MPRRRRSNIEVMLLALSRLPWPLCLALSPVSWLGFHQLALIEPPIAQGVDMGRTVMLSMLKTAGLFLQYLAPLLLMIGAALGWHAKRRRTRLVQEAGARTDAEALLALSWRDFEHLVGAWFEQQGYSVSFTPDGADGGVDLVARRGSETFLVQCKQWRATRVGVTTVRELFGVMAARGATGGYVVSIGPFTADAHAFAQGRNIDLVDARSVVARAGEIATPSSGTQAAAAPMCPRCGSAMVRRVAKQGPQRGSAFYGCSAYPRCRGTVAID